MSQYYDTVSRAAEALSDDSAAPEANHSPTPAFKHPARTPDEFTLLAALLIELKKADEARDIERFVLIASTMSQELHLLSLSYPQTAALVTRHNGRIAPFDRGVADSLRFVAARGQE